VAEILPEVRRVINEGINGINKSRVSPGSVIICGDEERAICQMVVGGDIDYFSFPADAIRDLVIVASKIGDGKAEATTNGFRLAGREPVSLRLELGVENGERTFKVTEVAKVKA